MSPCTSLGSNSGRSIVTNIGQPVCLISTFLISFRNSGSSGSFRSPRRRKAEGLTQREHAALASVSIPTIGAFERGKRTLTLAKAFDILRVVGLVVEEAEDGAQEAFIRDAYARWRELTSPLPADSPGRFPHGWYRFDYCLDGSAFSTRAVQLSGPTALVSGGIRSSQYLRNGGQIRRAALPGAALGVP
jgi:transcriptional regulator with XRE-family HTH domain